MNGNGNGNGGNGFPHGPTQDPTPNPLLPGVIFAIIQREGGLDAVSEVMADMDIEEMLAWTLQKVRELASGNNNGNGSSNGNGARPHRRGRVDVTHEVVDISSRSRRRSSRRRRQRTVVAHACFHARTPEQFANARALVAAYLALHPDDHGIGWSLESMSMREHFAGPPQR
jgi:hypothetical protein